MDRDPYAAPDCGPPPAAPAALPAFSPLLLRAMVTMMGGLMVGGLLLAGALVTYGALGRSRGTPIDDPYAAAFFAVLIGGLPLLVVGAPGYALLVRWGHANAVSVAALGAAPGLVLLAFGTPAGLGFTVFGIVVALVSHVLFWWGSRRDRSST